MGGTWKILDFIGYSVDFQVWKYQAMWRGEVKNVERKVGLKKDMLITSLNIYIRSFVLVNLMLIESIP